MTYTYAPLYKLLFSEYSVGVPVEYFMLGFLLLFLYVCLFIFTKVLIYVLYMRYREIHGLYSSICVSNKIKVTKSWQLTRKPDATTKTDYFILFYSILFYFILFYFVHLPLALLFFFPTLSAVLLLFFPSAFPFSFLQKLTENCYAWQLGHRSSPGPVHRWAMSLVTSLWNLFQVALMKHGSWPIYV